MANDNLKTSTAPFYQLSEPAHSQLRTVQETLLLLYLLTQSRAHDPMVPPSGWTSCLHLLGTEIQTVLDGAPWQEAA